MTRRPDRHAGVHFARWALTANAERSFTRQGTLGLTNAKTEPRCGCDPLSDVLGAVRFRSTIFCRSDMTAPWGFSVAAGHREFHFVERGHCWLEVEDAAAKIPLRSAIWLFCPTATHTSFATLLGLRSPGSTISQRASRTADDASVRRRRAETTLICAGSSSMTGTSCLSAALPPVLVVQEGRRAEVGYASPKTSFRPKSKPIVSARTRS